MVFHCQGSHLQFLQHSRWITSSNRSTVPKLIRRERQTHFILLWGQKNGASPWGETTQVFPSSSSGSGGGSSSSTCGETTPPRGGLEVLQADEYIKGLLLWTVQSFSCCFNAACPVPSVEQVSYRILRP